MEECVWIPKTHVSSHLLKRSKIANVVNIWRKTILISVLKNLRS